MTLGSSGCCRCQQWTFYADLRNQCQVFLQILSNWARKSYNNIEGSASETEANDMWSHPSAREMNSTFDDDFMPLTISSFLSQPSCDETGLRLFARANHACLFRSSIGCIDAMKLVSWWECLTWRSAKATNQGFVSLENQLLNISQSISGLHPSPVSDPFLNCLGHFYFLVSKVPQRS